MKNLLIVAGVVFVVAGAATADPAFTLLNTVDNLNGTWTSEYELSNIGGGYGVYDFDWSTASFQYGWAYVTTPQYWEYDNYYYMGPMSRFTTDQAPVGVDQTLGGFHITAGLPTHTNVTVTYTDLTHDIEVIGLATSEVQFPIPEPTSVALLALGGLAALRRRRRK